MKKKSLIIICSLILIGLGILFIFKFKNIDDSIKFKNEYESLNNKYYVVDISSKNTIKYSSYNEIFNILKKETAIVYFGYPEDDSSRYAIQTLLNVIEDKSKDTTIYYLNIKEDIDSLNNNYLELVKVLDNYLTVPYADVAYNTIYLPTMIFIKDGSILGLEHTSTSIEKEDLYSMYEDYITEMYSSTCDINNVEPC